MDKLLRLLGEQNKYFDPRDSLSNLINQTLSSVEDELDEEDLFFVQAARGSMHNKPADQRKETDLS